MNRYGVLLVGHGTRDQRGTDEFFQLGEQLAMELGPTAMVVPCLLEFQKPTIAEAWQTLAEQNCEQVVVAPLLLFAAGHAKSDIPGEVEAARQSTRQSTRQSARQSAPQTTRQANQTQSVDVVSCRPISRQSAMIDAIRQRVRQCAGESSGQSERTAIVMVGRGSRDVCASADMRLLSEVVIRGKDTRTGATLADELTIGQGGLFTTFYAMAQPRLPDTLAQVAQTEQFDRILVHPHLLFSGRLYDAIRRQVDEASERFSNVEFRVSDYLGPTREVACSIAGRIAEVQ